jgi:methionyl-tRNA formyltransferase
MGPRLDTGEIYLQQAFALDPRMTGGELEKKLIAEGLKLLEEFFRRAASNTLQTIPQKENEATHSHKIKKEDTCFSWQDPVVMIDRKVRAYYPKPRAFFEFRGKMIFVEEGEPVSFEGHSGEVKIDSLDREEGSVVLSLPQGEYSLKKVAPEGKSAMRAYDFLQGFRLRRGDIFK